MNRFLGFLLSLLLAGCQPKTAVDSAQKENAAPSIEVYFSPNGGCTKKIVEELTHAQHTVLLQAYNFTSAPVAKALVEAHQRGVSITAVLDRSNRTTKYSAADFVAHAGISTYIDAAHPIAHNKVMVIDDVEVITGSFNFTKAAEYSNAENLVIIHDPQIAAKYAANFEVHRAHSEWYVGR